jgi:hypothetical protein
MKNKDKLTKLEKAIAKAVLTESKREPLEDSGYYNEDDTLKHYIRKYYWEKRITRLKRDANPALVNGIKYFSFCSIRAFDVRYFIKQKLINTNSKVPFAFVEFVKDDFEFLAQTYINKNLGSGFCGSFDDIATNSDNENYGKFWSTFPYDVINLDYLGDILKTNNHSGKIGENDFYAIQSVINKQFFLRRPYELWITMRAKEGRYEPAVKQAFRKLITYHRENYKDTFDENFKKHFPGKTVNNLIDEDLFLVGYINWLYYVCKLSCSTIPHIQVIKYKRIDKDKREYFLYNIFLRIAPYNDIVIPSPASDAVTFCEDEYSEGIINCFTKAIDVTAEFNAKKTELEDSLKAELKTLGEEYSEDFKGYIS